MGCNCGGRKAATTEYTVILKDGTTQEGFTSEIQAKVAAAKLGGVVKPKTAA